MTRFSKHELSEIYQGEVTAVSDFIALHRKKGDRPATWFTQQERRLAAHMQIHEWLKQAAARDAKEEAQNG